MISFENKLNKARVSDSNTALISLISMGGYKVCRWTDGSPECPQRHRYSRVIHCRHRGWGLCCSWKGARARRLPLLSHTYEGFTWKQQIVFQSSLSREDVHQLQLRQESFTLYSS